MEREKRQKSGHRRAVADFHRIVVLPSADASSSSYPSFHSNVQGRTKEAQNEESPFAVRLCAKALRSVTPLSFSPFKVRALLRDGTGTS